MPQSRFLAILLTLIALFIVGSFFGNVTKDLFDNGKFTNDVFLFIGVLLVSAGILIGFIFMITITQSNIPEIEIGPGKISAFARSIEDNDTFLWAFDENGHIKKFRFPNFYTKDFLNFCLRLPLLHEMPQTELRIVNKIFENPDSVRVLPQLCVDIVKKEQLSELAKPHS